MWYETTNFNFTADKERCESACVWARACIDMDGALSRFHFNKQQQMKHINLMIHTLPVYYTSCFYVFWKEQYMHFSEREAEFVLYRSVSHQKTGTATRYSNFHQLHLHLEKIRKKCSNIILITLMQFHACERMPWVQWYMSTFVVLSREMKILDSIFAAHPKLLQ